MRKQYSLTRREYGQAYMELRKFSGAPYVLEHWFCECEEQDCALESYDYSSSEFSGWINRQRMSQFKKRSWDVQNWRGEIPF